MLLARQPRTELQLSHSLLSPCFTVTLLVAVFTPLPSHGVKPLSSVALCHVAALRCKRERTRQPALNSTLACSFSVLFSCAATVCV